MQDSIKNNNVGNNKTHPETLVNHQTIRLPTVSKHHRRHPPSPGRLGTSKRLRLVSTRSILRLGESIQSSDTSYTSPEVRQNYKIQLHI